MKRWEKSEKIVKFLKTNWYITRESVKDICWDPNSVHAVIDSLIKKWYKIKRIKDNEWVARKYIYIGYVKPFYLISRDIEKNYPKLEKFIRLIYNLINKND